MGCLLYTTKNPGYLGFRRVASVQPSIRGGVAMKTREQVPFRLIQTPCCGHLLCWVNPRLPTYCPECGSFILSQLRPDVNGKILRTTAGWLELPAENT